MVPSLLKSTSVPYLSLAVPSKSTPTCTQADADASQSKTLTKPRLSLEAFPPSWKGPPTASLDPSEDNETDLPYSSPAACPSISLPNFTQFPDCNSYTLTCPLLSEELFPASL